MLLTEKFGFVVDEVNAVPVPALENVISEAGDEFVICKLLLASVINIPVEADMLLTEKFGFAVDEVNVVPVPPFENVISEAGDEFVICKLLLISEIDIPVEADKLLTDNAGADPLTINDEPAPAFDNVEADIVFVNVIKSVVVDIDNPSPTANPLRTKSGFVSDLIKLSPKPDVPKVINVDGSVFDNEILLLFNTRPTPLNADIEFNSKTSPVPVLTSDVPNPPLFN